MVNGRNPRQRSIKGDSHVIEKSRNGTDTSDMAGPSGQKDAGHSCLWNMFSSQLTWFSSATPDFLPATGKDDGWQFWIYKICDLTLWHSYITCRTDPDWTSMGHMPISEPVMVARGMKSESHSVMSSSLQPRGLYSPWNSPGQNTGVGSCSLLQGLFPTKGSDPGLLDHRQILLAGGNGALELVASLGPVPAHTCRERWVQGACFTGTVWNGPFCQTKISCPD